MTIQRRKKRSGGGGAGGGALMLNIRVRHLKKKGQPDTERVTIRQALQTLLDTGRMPDGWQFMAVDWKNPSKYGTSWQSGFRTSDDESEFLDAFAAVVQDQLRVARVRKL